MDDHAVPCCERPDGSSAYGTNRGAGERAHLCVAPLEGIVLRRTKLLALPPMSVVAKDVSSILVFGPLTVGHVLQPMFSVSDDPMRGKRAATYGPRVGIVLPVGVRKVSAAAEDKRETTS